MRVACQSLQPNLPKNDPHNNTGLADGPGATSGDEDDPEFRDEETLGEEPGERVVKEAGRGSGASCQAAATFASTD